MYISSVVHAVTTTHHVQVSAVICGGERATMMPREVCTGARVAGGKRWLAMLQVLRRCFKRYLLFISCF